MTVRTIDEIFRDFVTDGVPASGPFNPHKPDIRDTLKALTEGSENFPDNRVIRLNNADEGTANNIVVTASVAIPAAAYQVLYILNVTQENTGPVTVSGAINRALVTNTNQAVPAGYLTPGMALLCIDTGSELRLLSYGDAEAIAQAAEDAAAAAIAAKEAAESAAGALLSSFDTKVAVQAANIPNQVNYVRTAGFSVVGDGGAALYKRVASEPSHIGKVQSADGAWWEIVDRVLRPEMFGGKSEAGFDNKAALEGGIKFAFSIGGEFRIDKNYETTDIVIDAGQGTVAGTGWLISHANSNQGDVYESQLITFTSGVNYSDISLRIDLANQSKSGMAVKGDENKIDCICKNAIMTVGRTHHIWALRVAGDLVGGKGNKNHVGFVLAWKMISPSVDGTVAANALVVDAYARDTNVDYIWATEGPAALINNGRRTTVDFIYCKDCIDNVVYDIEGAENLKIGTVFAVNATDEVICLRGDTNPYIGKVIMYECGVGVGVSDSASPAIGEIFWQNYGTVASGAPLYVRPTQTGITNRINVDKLTIRGTWKTGAPILSFTNGGVKEVRIGEITADIYYSDATATKALAFWQGCEELHIGSVDIQASDTTGTLTVATGLTLNLPSTLTRSSFIGGMNLSARGAFSVRANNIGTFLTIGGVPFIRGDLGNVVSNQDGEVNAIRIFQSGLAPSAGTWRRGDVVYNTAPAASGFIGWVCTASGSPGTWKTFGAIST